MNIENEGLSNLLVKYRIESSQIDLFVFACEAMSLGMPGLIAKHRENENAEPFRNMESFRNSARELLLRIDQLEKKQAKVRHAFTHMTTI